jgi:retron-type reverse transcriptase
MNSHNAKKPIGGASVRRVMESPDPNDHLLERILSRENMQSAWKRVKANKGIAGVDNMSIETFPAFAREHWKNIRQSLLAGTYQPINPCRSNGCKSLNRRVVIALWESHRLKTG